ncbi:MAG: hypothetical protein ACK4ND_01850 [Cytophagaceae bacterium]
MNRFIIFFFLSALLTAEAYSQAPYKLSQSVIEMPATPGSSHIITLNHGTVLYEGEYFIVLQDGFHVTSTGTTSNYFHAYISSPIYAELKDKLDQSYYLARNGRLFFKYIETYFPDGNLSYKIYDYQRNQLVPAIPPKALKRHVGTNFMDLDCMALNLTPNDGINSFYILEVENDKGEKKYLRFKYVL